MSDNGIKLEHRLAVIETQLLHIDKSLNEIKDDMKGHISSAEQILEKFNTIKDDLVEKVDKTNIQVAKNKTYIKVASWAMGIVIAGGSGAAGLLKIIL